MNEQNQNRQPDISSELEALRRRVARLERRVKKLEQERDEAREHVIVKRIVDVHRRESFCRYRGAYLPLEFINRIRLGEMTIEQAIEERGKRWPVCTYGDKNGLSLEQAYREAV